MMPASRPNIARIVSVLWTEGNWRCELHTGGIANEGRILVYRGDTVVTAESVHLSAAMHTLSEILRQRVLRGDLRAE